MSDVLDRPEWPSTLDKYKPCSRCGIKYRPNWRCKVVLCRDCRYVMTSKQVKQWLEK